MIAGPTPAQVAAQVAIIRRQRPEARVIGMHAPGGWPGGATITVNGESCNVIHCSSALQLREALVSLNEGRGRQDVGRDSLAGGEGAAAEPLLVVITSLDEGQLGLDVLARLAGRQLYRIDRWQMVRDLFRARAIDPRLPAQEWLAEALLQHIPAGGYPPVASGLLDADTVWKHLLAQYLELPDGHPDARALLTWSLSASSLHRYEALSGELRAALRQRLQDTAGAVGSAMLDALDSGYGALLLPIGLVCEILFSAAGQRQIGIAQARARLESYLAGRLPSSEVGRAWAAAAVSVLTALPESQRHDWLGRTEALLTDLKATDYSALSCVLPSGLQQRLSHFAAALQGFLRGKGTLEQLEERFQHVAGHHESTWQRARLERVHMALRLARYLGTKPQQPGTLSLAQAASLYAAHGGYVDWARRSLLSGDATADLAAAFRLLADRIRQVREQQNQQFATLLATWYKAPGLSAGLLPIEQALSHIVARLAKTAPVLLLVLDALSYADCCELVQNLRQRGWTTLTDQPGQPLPFLLSTVPSVTAMARTSLFAGRLAHGTSAIEKQSFASHADLLAVSRPAYPPVLFHKGELLEAGATGLSSVVRQALQHEQQRIVGVVVNAVDDHLAKSEQLRLAWTVEQIHHLDALLYEAQIAQRVVVMTSDHGHVLEAGSRRLSRSTEERWRPYDDQIAAEELVFAGPRVQQVTGVERIIAPWSEAVRYSHKKQGYHGGATPQEILVPVAVLVPQHRTLTGWVALPEREPAWWNQEEQQHAVPTPLGRTRQHPGQAVAAQGTLFAGMHAEDGTEPGASWIDQLISTPVFAAQRRLAGRRAPDEQHLRACLAALEGHGGRLTQRLLEQVLEVPEFRLRGILTGLQRLLNVDGYQVLTIDDSAGTVALQRQLLDTQFQLSSPHLHG